MNQLMEFKSLLSLPVHFKEDRAICWSIIMWFFHTILMPDARWHKSEGEIIVSSRYVIYLQ